MRIIGKNSGGGGGEKAFDRGDLWLRIHNGPWIRLGTLGNASFLMPDSNRKPYSHLGRTVDGKDKSSLRH